MAKPEWKSTLYSQYIEGKGNCVFTRQQLMPNEIIGYFEGTWTDVDTVHSVSFKYGKINGTCILRNLSHSCEPNAIFKHKRRWLHAITAIGADCEITIDYEYTETFLCNPFICRCGSLNCRGIIGKLQRISLFGG